MTTLRLEAALTHRTEWELHRSGRNSMLVLTRKKGEKIILVDSQDQTRTIEIVVSRFNGSNSVRLAIQAPKDIHIPKGSKKKAAGTS